ncbi:YitT family protein [Tepidimicrobium xylanilyticum]|uniref:YitT family protein n=1 Tax=Tepidimicrobium xylanilyticum TaxID=1123352 RepID=UPI001356629F|nr:YitT family protein [Tepidimicrobium xylanilyticum]
MTVNIVNDIPIITIGIIVFISNLVLFIIAFIAVGKDFERYTIYSSFFLAILIYILEVIVQVETPLVDDLMINLIFGILIQGIGMAIIFYQNSSTGGTDIVAKIINKYFNLEIGKALLLADFMIVFLVGISFDKTLGLYALLGIIFNFYVIDNFIKGLKKKSNIFIISERSFEINDFIYKYIRVRFNNFLC